MTRRIPPALSYFTKVRRIRPWSRIPTWNCTPPPPGSHSGSRPKPTPTLTAWGCHWRVHPGFIVSPTNTTQPNHQKRIRMKTDFPSRIDMYSSVDQVTYPYRQTSVFLNHLSSVKEKNLLTPEELAVRLTARCKFSSGTLSQGSLSRVSYHLASD